MPVEVASASAAIATFRGRSAVAAITPGTVVGALLLVCAAKGVWISLGVEVPPDADTVRDLGFIQGFLDGNWAGDPAIQGAWRWYPPLLHGVAALLIAGLRLPVLATWLHAGAVLNLLSTLSFFLMNRRLIGGWPAAAATTVFVLFDGVAMPSDAAGGYTPWTLTPALVWPMFFGSVWLIADRVPRRWTIDAVAVGSALGLVFLAHTIPALLLSGIVVAAAVATHGLNGRTLVWLAVVAAVEVAWAAPFLLPLVVIYRLHIVNTVPGEWVHPALTEWATVVPNLLGVFVLGWLVWRREWLRLPAVTTAIFGTWIGLCVLFIARHYGCALAGNGRVCSVFVVAPHHYHVYLQAAWAGLVGLALTRLWALRQRRNLVPVAILAGIVGLAGFFTKTEDQNLRQMGSTQPELVLDQTAYAWILQETNPEDLFVTELPAKGPDMGPGAATVMAAGRRLVAPPQYFSNPYVAWAPMNAIRIGYLTAGVNLCPLVRQAGAGTAFFLLPSGRVFSGGAAVFRSGFNTIYQVDRGYCVG